MNRKKVYLFLCFLGAAIPYSQFVPWVMENGLQLGLLVRQLFVNRISAFFGLDVLVSSVVLLMFMRVEGRQVRMRLRWLPIVGLLTVRVSLACRCFSIFANARWKDQKQPIIAGQLRRSTLRGPEW